MTPFVAFSLPRSGSLWWSRFLTYGDYYCAHDQAAHIRNLDDVRSWLGQDFTGTIETAAAPWWRLVRHIRPDAKILIIRRPVCEIFESVMRVDLRDTLRLDRDVLARNLTAMDRKLDQIERSVPDAVSVQFSAINNEDECRRVFERLLPYKHDSGWWQTMAATNIQDNVPAKMRHMTAHTAQLAKAALLCTREVKLAAWHSRTPPELDGMTLQEESFETFWHDGQALFAEHCVEVGEAPDQYLRKNVALMRRLDRAGVGQIITARSNGRMFGYLTTVISPSLEDETIKVATQLSSYASRDTHGLGLRMQRAAIEGLRRRGGRWHVLMRAGIRGQGERIGVLYERMGAEKFGQIYRLELEAA